MNVTVQGQILDTHGAGVANTQISVIDSLSHSYARVFKDNTLSTPTSAIFNTDLFGNYGPVYTANPDIVKAFASDYVFLDGTDAIVPVCISDPTTVPYVVSWDTRIGAVLPATNDYTWAQINKTISNLADITTRAFAATGSIGLYNGSDALLSGNYPFSLKSGISNGASAVGFIFDTTNALLNATARVLSIRSGGGTPIVDIGFNGTDLTWYSGSTFGGILNFRAPSTTGFRFVGPTGTGIAYGINLVIPAFTTNQVGASATMLFASDNGLGNGFQFGMDETGVGDNFNFIGIGETFYPHLGSPSFPWNKAYIFSTIYGVSQSASITYNGTDLVINPKLIGTGIVQISGTVKASAYQSSDGTAGATAGPFTTITSITVKNGLVTNLTGS